MQIEEIPTPGRGPVVVVYEDYEAGRRAQYACQQILQAAHLEKAVNIDMWKFDMFKLRSMSDMATADAAEAELMVLALQGGDTLPSCILQWIQSSLQRRSARPKAVLVLMGVTTLTGNQPAPSAEGQLRELIENAGLPLWFLCLVESQRGQWTEPSYDPDDLELVAQAVFRPGQPSRNSGPAQFNVPGNQI